MATDLQRETDEDLACRVQAGSLACFDELVCRHQERVYQFLRLKLGQSQDAEDVTQTTFIAAYRAIHRYRPRHRFVTWLFTIARRQAVSYYRARRAAEPLLREPVDTRTPDQALASRDTWGELWSLARATLPEKQVSAMWLRYAEDMNMREIAQAMGVGVTHVKVLLHRGRKALAAELGRHPSPTRPPPLPATIVQENPS